MNKVERYEWTALDAEGDLQWIDKAELSVDHTYQRPEAKQKVLRIASEFSWQKFGCLVVSERQSGEMVVIDGQHRALAAIRRDDVNKVPCIVFRELQLADEAVCIGDAPSSKSYLNIPNILAAATSRGADAIHPGYGFLAENDKFAEICAAHGLTFVGPSPESIREKVRRMIAARKAVNGNGR
mgnify:CR=1 FL=1